MANYSGKYDDKRRLLGRGTFGEAWLVVSKTSGRYYVMKEMVTGAWDNKAMTEVNILASCNHVNIVRYAGAHIVHKSLVTEKILIMEYADADDLADTIKRQKESPNR